MPKLPILSGKKLIKILFKIRFKHIRTRGSHAILNKQDNEKGKITIPVPLHPELAKDTLKSIMNQVGLKLDELLDLMWNDFADINRDGNVDLEDLADFSNEWLWKAEDWTKWYFYLQQIRWWLFLNESFINIFCL